MPAARWDLAIVGAGSAGLIAADFASKVGARVVLLERERIGGDCTWLGCVPSKALIRTAKAAHEIRNAARFGIDEHEPAVDFGRVRDYVRQAIERIYDGTTPEALARKGIDVVFGAVRFEGPRALFAGGRRIDAKRVLIAVGARPVVPRIPGLEQVPFATYRDIFERDRLPRLLCVVGGGPVGIEIAQAYRRLGAEVTIVAERLLPKEEPESSALIERVLQREGLTLVRGRADAVTGVAGNIVVTAAGERVPCDLLLIAAGRAPALDGLQLGQAGIAHGARGIVVDRHLRTSRPHIFAAGDVLGGEQFSHLAGWQGFVAARNALLPGAARGTPRAVPRVTFTDPEVAAVGATEAEARGSRPREVEVSSWPITRADRAVCDDDREGLIKLVTTRGGTILGATIVGARAGEAIAEIALAMQRNLRLRDIAGAVHPYPTYPTTVQLLASEIVLKRTVAGAAGQVMRAWLRALR